MATDIQTLADAIDKLTKAIAPIVDFTSSWKLREQQPGLNTKLPTAFPFRPTQNQTVIIALGVADAISIPLSQGLYDLTADNDCFIAINRMATLTDSYPIRGGLVYAQLRIVNHDILHVIAAAAGGNLYLSPVE